MRKTLGSVPRRRTSGRRFRPGWIQGGITTPRPIDRRDTRGASPEAIGTSIDAGIGCGGIAHGWWSSPSSFRLSPACLGDDLPYPAEAVIVPHGDPFKD